MTHTFRVILRSGDTFEVTTHAAHDYRHQLDTRGVRVADVAHVFEIGRAQ